MTDWPQIEAALDGILARRWYTNHGPLAQQLERQAALKLGVPHALAVTNPTIGLLMLAEGLKLSGDVLLSALAPRRCAQALAWAGLRPVFCDVDAATLGMSPGTVSREVRLSTRAILGTAGADAAELADLASAHGLAFFQDGMGAHPGPALIHLPGWGDEAGAACVATVDDGLAACLRNIRSSYGAGPPVQVARTANGRLSEAQAAMALLALDRTASPLDGFMDGLQGARVLNHGNEAAVAVENTAARDRLKDALSAAGRAVQAPVLDPRAAGCPVALGIAGQMLVVRAGAPAGRQAGFAAAGGSC